MRVVASLSAIGTDKVDLLHTFESLKNQKYKFDEIYITVTPEIKFSLSEISEICKIVELDKSYSLFAKIYGPLVREQDKNTLIISLTPGIIYSENLSRIMIDKHKKYSKSIINLGDGIELYVRDFFPSFKNLFKLQKSRDIFSYLSSQEITKLSVSIPGCYTARLTKNYSSISKTQLSNHLVKLNSLQNEYGMIHDTKNVSLQEPYGGRLLFLIIIMVIVFGVRYSL